MRVTYLSGILVLLKKIIKILKFKNLKFIQVTTNLKIKYIYCIHY